MKRNSKSKAGRKLSLLARPLARKGDKPPSVTAKAVAWVAAVVIVAVAAALGFSALEGRVLTGSIGTGPTAVRIVLSDRPAWMPGPLAAQLTAWLARGGLDYYNKRLTAAVFDRAKANPWVRQVIRVTKRRSDDPRVAVVEVQAVFRMPVAKIYTPTGYAYVDAEGVRLPAGQVPQWASADQSTPGVSGRTYYLRRCDVPPRQRAWRIHYILIDGVQAPPPPVGARWPGEDLAAGLRLIALIAAKPYAYQISAVDVRNYGGRLLDDQPHLRMYAQLGRSRPTDIRFGRFPRFDGDYNVSPERKISYLDEYAADHGGRLAGINRYLDLRYDELHVSVN